MSCASAAGAAVESIQGVAWAASQRRAGSLRDAPLEKSSPAAPDGGRGDGEGVSSATPSLAFRSRPPEDVSPWRVGFGTRFSPGN